MIDAAEVQGNVLYAYGEDFRCARYVLLRINHVAEARAVLRSWVEHVSFGRRPWEASGAGPSLSDDALDPPAAAVDCPHVNIAFTFRGLKALSVPDEFLYSFPVAFREGALARSRDNGDLAASSSEHWVDHLGTGDILLVVHATDETDRDRMVDQLLAGTRGRLTVLHDLPAARGQPGSRPTSAGSDSGVPPGLACNSTVDREHFGFADGCSQPAIEGVNTDPVGEGVYARVGPRWWRPLRSLELVLEDLGLKSTRKRWRLISAGEFVLGYENEDGTLSSGPPAPLGPNGTFMVYRPMSQDVRGFNDHVASEAERLGLEPELLRAKIVGRWSDGTPITLSPERPDSLIADNRRRANDFLYREERPGLPSDADGFACPFGAHVRRANPRDALPGGGERTMRHRIIRRGMPYGSRDRDDECGLAFVCYSASIVDGFEFIQRTWCNAGAEVGLVGERDPLLQQGEPGQLTGMVIPASDNGTVIMNPPPKPFVTVRGCEYLFVPSRTACEWLMSLA